MSIASTHWNHKNDALKTTQTHTLEYQKNYPKFFLPIKDCPLLKVVTFFIFFLLEHKRIDSIESFAMMPFPKFETLHYFKKYIN